MVFIHPLFASGINAGANSAPCTDTTLETYSGNSNLSADWQANKIDVYWYDGNTKVSGGPTSCTYDGTLNIPPTPTKTGYTLEGWYTTSNFASGTKVTSSTRISTADPTLYAKWTLGNYTIALDAATNGGTNGTTIYTTYTTNVYKDSARTKIMDTYSNNVAMARKTNNVFTGYYSAASGGTLVHIIANFLTTAKN